MKKIWALLLLLLLLIICCVWCHTNSIYEEHAKATAVPIESVVKKEPATVIPPKPVAKEPIEFTITNSINGTTLDGTFGHVNQEKTLTSGFTNTKNVNSSVNLALNNKTEIVDKVKTLLPNFLSSFDDGTIQYKNTSLTITGETTSQEAKDKLEHELTGLGVDFVNNTKLLVENKDQANLSKTDKAANDEIQAMLALNIIEFRSGSSMLTAKGKATVGKLQEILTKYKEVRIKLSGHTDSDGDDASNLKLSQKRVDQIKSALVKQSIVADRMETEGFGESQPLVENNSRENKQKNRRVEISILGGN